MLVAKASKHLEADEGRDTTPERIRLGNEVVATQIFVIFNPQFGEDFHFDSYFSDGLKPPTRKGSSHPPPPHPKFLSSESKSTPRKNFVGLEDETIFPIGIR